MLVLSACHPCNGLLDGCPALLFRDRLAVEWEGYDARQFDPAWAEGDLHRFGKTRAGEIASVVPKTTCFGPIKVGILEVAIESLDAAKGCSDKGSAFEIAVDEDCVAEIRVFEGCISGVCAVEAGGKERGTLEDRV